MARAGPEPSTLYFLPFSSVERLQPAYCEPRQASTGWAVCTVTMNGHALSVSVVSSATRPRPPRQISAMRRPASSPPTARTPQSMRHSPSVPCGNLDSQRAGVSDESFDERRRLGVDAGSLHLAPGDFFSFVHRSPPCSALKHRLDFANSLLDQAFGARPVPARATTVHIGRFLSIRSDRLRTIRRPIGPDESRQAPHRRSRHRRLPRPWHPRISARAGGSFPALTASTWRPNKRRRAAVENVERGAGPRVDLEQQRALAVAPGNRPRRDP